jgi:uncharacterized protein YbaR (Trm112 family)
MFIELVELLRCTRPHEESWLVAAMDRVENRVILAGRLGCPVCSSEYEIRDGIVELDRDRPDHASGDLVPPAPADPWRLAALLDLRPPASVAVVEAAEPDAVDALLEIFTGSIVVLNPLHAPAPRERLAVLRAPGRIPLRAHSADAVAVRGSNERLLLDAVHVLRAGGRLLAPEIAPLPQGTREIARDGHEWLAVRETGGAPVQLRRG